MNSHRHKQVDINLLFNMADRCLLHFKDYNLLEWEAMSLVEITEKYTVSIFFPLSASISLKTKQELSTETINLYQKKLSL
jgi:uncharacterized protein YdeI (YjbR/CyaY-like superfamily)